MDRQPDILEQPKERELGFKERVMRSLRNPSVIIGLIVIISLFIIVLVLLMYVLIIRMSKKEEDPQPKKKAETKKTKKQPEQPAAQSAQQPPAVAQQANIKVPDQVKPPLEQKKEEVIAKYNDSEVEAKVEMSETQEEKSSEDEPIVELTN